MAAYKVAASSTIKFDNVDTQIVNANSSAEAKALAKALRSDDIDDIWDDATITSLANVDFNGWSFRIQIDTGTPIDVTVTPSTTCTLAQLAALLVTALNATAINGANYNSGQFLLTVAETTDGIGDKALTITVTPPSSLFPSDHTFVDSTLISAVVDGGSSGDALTIAFSSTFETPRRTLAFSR